MNNGLKHLHLLADRHKAEKYPNVPAFARVKSKYDDRTANSLTRCIIDYITFTGGHATRIQSTGMVRKNVGWTYGSTRKGTADIHAVINGRHFSIEVKIGTDRQSKAQKRVQAEVERAGGCYLLVKNFEQFYDAVHAPKAIDDFVREFSR